MEITVSIKVSPNSKKQEIKIDGSGIIKCLLTSLPEKGKANKELIKLLSKKLSLPRSNIVILKGLTSKTKFLKIIGIKSVEEFLNRLGLEKQLTIE